MNGQNFFNSQNNSNDVNSNSAPMKPVKNRFFNQELFDDTSFEEVGSSTSNQVNNQVVSWGVGGNRENRSNVSAVSQQMNSLFSQELLEDVNGTVYTADQPEILDDFMINEPLNSSLPNSNDTLNESLFGYTEPANILNQNNMKQKKLFNSIFFV